MATHETTAPLYTRESIFREGWRELRQLVAYRELVRHLVGSSLAKENTGRVFGYLWWLLDPLLLVGVYVVVVDVIFQRGGENYALFVFVGLTAWKYFASTVVGAITGTLSRERMLRQVHFPKTTIPLATGLAGTVQFLVALGVLIAVAIPFGVYPNPIILAVVLVIAVELVFLLGLAYLLASLNIFFRDIENLAGYTFRAWFFLSPVLYPVSMVPAEYRDLYELNPFATIIPAYQDILIDHRAPDFGALGIVAAAALALLTCGYLVFVKLEPSFAKVS